MKRIWILLFCLALLTGCGLDPQTPTAPETPTANTTVPSATAEVTLPQEQPGVPLLEQGQAVGETGNLLYIPNPHVASMSCPEIRLYGNGLLLYEHRMDGQLHIKRISLEDGSLLAEASYPVNPATSVQVGNGLIGLCDGGNGQVLLLNEALEQEKTYTVDLKGENWFLNQELETLYVFDYEEGLLSYDLETGKTNWLLNNAAFVQTMGEGNGYILFSYTDRASQKSNRLCLNLSTAVLETFPLEGPAHSGIRSGERWLLRQDVASGTYVLVNQTEAVTFQQPEGLVELLAGRRQLLTIDGSYRELSVYDLDGNFLSGCTLPKIEHATVGTDLIWSGYWKGYFFRDTYDNSAHLMFWDTGLPQTGENLSVAPLGTVPPSEPVLEQALYQKAEALSQRFGVDIRIAEQCALTYSHYQGNILKDPHWVRYALDVLEQAFGSYPDGFLRQLPFGQLQKIRIELVSDLRGNDQMDTHPAAIGGFAQTMPDHYLIVFDSISLDADTVYHELSHVIDKRLEWDASLRPQALFREETWLSLQPQGFRYAHSYTEMPDAVAAYENSGYFVSRYSMTFPTEDRATLMSAVMSDKTILQENPGMAEKMRYYAACIRDCFDTEGWPETTLWEQPQK